MLTQTIKKDRSAILEYWLAEPNANLFILSDIENSAFENTFAELVFRLWISV